MRKKEVNIKDFFEDLVSEGISSLVNDNNRIGIVEFAEEIVFNGEESLYPPQRAILKALYGDKLTEDELLILHEWKGESPSRTTWVEDREYSNLILEAGRGLN